MTVCTDMDDNSNSSGDSGNGYHGEEEPRHQPAIPVHRNESISLSDMEKYSTDVEVRGRGGGGTGFAVLLLLTGRCCEAEICANLLLLRCSFRWNPFLPKSKFSEFGQ